MAAMRIKLLIPVVFLATSAHLAACGGGSDWFPADVDEDSTLAAAGAAKVCDAFEAYLYDQYRESLFVRVACTALGIENTTDAAACGDYVSDCIENPPPQVDTMITTLVDGVGCGGLAYQSSGCSATISQLRACLDAADAEVQELRYSLECNLAGQPIPPGGLMIDTPASCATIENQCPRPPG